MFGRSPLAALIVFAAFMAAAPAASANHFDLLDDPPTVSIADPLDGATLPHGQATTIRATASDDAGVTQVEFFVDGASIGPPVTTPDADGKYTIDYEPPAGDAGAIRQITARASDSAAPTPHTTDDVIDVLIADNPPTVSITSPSDGDTIPHDATTTIRATAADDRAVQAVEFRRGSTLIGTDNAPDSGSSYSIDYTPAASDAGSGQALVATAVDDRGHRSSAAIGVKVSSPPPPPPQQQQQPQQPAPDDAPPTVAITGPAPGAAIDPVAAPRITADAADDHGVARVEFLDDGQVVCRDDTAPYDCAYRPTGDDVGRNTLIAIAVDGAGQAGVDFRAVSVGRFTPQLTARTTPGRDRRRPYRYATTGSLVLPAGVTPAQACAGGGSVTIEFAAGKLKLPQTAALKPDCTFRSSIAFPSRRSLGNGRLIVRTRFAGNAVVGGAAAKSQRVRAG